MGAPRIPKSTNAHRRQWEGSVSRSQYQDIDPEQIGESARVDDDSGSEQELTAQEIRRRRHARQNTNTDNDELIERVSRKQLDYDSNDVEESEADEEEAFESESEEEEMLQSEDDAVESENDVSAIVETIPAISSNNDAVKALADLEREDSTFLLDSSRSKEQDQVQAASVRHQRKLYESALDLRMSLQKPLQMIGRLPYGDDFDLVCDQSVEIADSFRTSADLLSDVLADLTHLESRLLNASGIFGSVEVKAINVKKRQRPDLDAIWSEIDARFEATRSGRESTIDYWNRRTQVAAGGHALNNKKFKALNQSVLAQIKTNLADMEPLRQRAFLNKNQVSALASDQAAEVFDDTDFYHLLLKELISSANEEAAAIGRVSRRGSSDPAGKQVDRRASKGRKIKFVVHEKIVNFMAPCSRDIVFDYDVDHLFTHLFAT